jgi:hypothetical protein
MDLGWSDWALIFWEENNDTDIRMSGKDFATRFCKAIPSHLSIFAAS